MRREGKLKGGMEGMQKGVEEGRKGMAEMKRRKI